MTYIVIYVYEQFMALFLFLIFWEPLGNLSWTHNNERLKISKLSLQNIFVCLELSVGGDSGVQASAEMPQDRGHGAWCQPINSSLSLLLQVYDLSLESPQKFWKTLRI